MLANRPLPSRMARGGTWKMKLRNCTSFFRESLHPIKRPATDRVLRGGSWFNHPKVCRSALRSSLRPVGRITCDGFRVVIRRKRDAKG